MIKPNLDKPEPKRKISSQKLNEHKIKSKKSFFVSCSLFVSEIFLLFGLEKNYKGTTFLSRLRLKEIAPSERNYQYLF